MNQGVFHHFGVSDTSTALLLVWNLRNLWLGCATGSDDVRVPPWEHPDSGKRVFPYFAFLIYKNSILLSIAVVCECIRPLIADTIGVR